MLSNIF